MIKNQKLILELITKCVCFIVIVKENENWMRHGYPSSMGTPITILKRGPSNGTPQIDSQVKYKCYNVVCTYSVLFNY